MTPRQERIREQVERTLDLAPEDTGIGGSPLPAATLDDLDAKVRATGPVDAGAAVRALGSPDAPAVVEAPRKKRGRPPLGTSPLQTPRAIHEREKRAERNAAAAAGAGASAKHKETFAEVASERDALRARLDVAATATFTDAQLANSKAAVVGILAILSIGFEFGGIPEGVHSDAEAEEVGDAFMKPVAPLLATAGKYADWAVAVAVLAKVEWPKIKLYKERMDREADARETARLTRGRIELDVAPSAATLSGGIIP